MPRVPRILLSLGLRIAILHYPTFSLCGVSFLYAFPYLRLPPRVLALLRLARTNVPNNLLARRPLLFAIDNWALSRTATGVGRRTRRPLLRTGAAGKGERLSRITP